MQLLKMKERLTTFQAQHPKALMFLQDVGKNSIKEGTIIEMSVTDPNGRHSVTNIRLTAEDVETIEMLKGMQ